MQEAPEGYTYIRLELPFDRAWASLGGALEKAQARSKKTLLACRRALRTVIAARPRLEFL